MRSATVGAALAVCLLLAPTGPVAAQWTPDPGDCERYQFRVDAVSGDVDAAPGETVGYGNLSAAERDLFDRALASDGAVLVRGNETAVLLGLPRAVVHEETTYRTRRTGSRCGLPWAPGIGAIRTVGVLVLLAVGALAGRRLLD